MCEERMNQIEDEAMEIDVETFVTCRLCVEEKGKYQISLKLRGMIKFAFDINIIHYDGLSQVVCNNCKALVNTFHEAKETYQVKQKMLHEKVKTGMVKSISYESVSSGSAKQMDFDGDLTKTTEHRSIKSKERITCASMQKEQNRPSFDSESGKSCIVDVSKCSPQRFPEKTEIEEENTENNAKKEDIVLDKPKTSPKIITMISPSDEHRPSSDAESNNLSVITQLRNDKSRHEIEELLLEQQSTNDKKIQDRNELFVSRNTELRRIRSRVGVDSSSDEECQASLHAKSAESFGFVDTDERDIEDFVSVPEKLTVKNCSTEYREIEGRKKHMAIHGKKRNIIRTPSSSPGNNSPTSNIGSMNCYSNSDLKENNLDSVTETILIGNENPEKNEIEKKINKIHLLQIWSKDYRRVYVCRYCNRRLQDKDSISDHVSKNHETLMEKRFNLTPCHSVIKMTKIDDIPKCTQSSSVVFINSEKLVRGNDNADYYELYTPTDHDDPVQISASTKRNICEDVVSEDDDSERDKDHERISFTYSASEDTEMITGSDTETYTDNENSSTSSVNLSEESLTGADDRNSKDKFDLSIKSKSKVKANTKRNCDTLHTRHTRAATKVKNKNINEQSIKINDHHIIRKIISCESSSANIALCRNRRKNQQLKSRERGHLRSFFKSLERDSVDSSRTWNIGLLNLLKKKNLKMCWKNPEEIKRTHQASSIYNYVRIHAVPHGKRVMSNLSGFQPFHDIIEEENSYLSKTDPVSSQHVHFTIGKKDTSTAPNSVKVTPTSTVTAIVSSSALETVDTLHASISKTPDQVSHTAFNVSSENNADFIRNKGTDISIFSFKRRELNPTCIQHAAKKKVIGGIIKENNIKEVIICLDSDTESTSPPLSASSVMTTLPIPTAIETTSSIRSSSSQDLVSLTQKCSLELSTTWKSNQPQNMPANKPTGYVVPTTTNNNHSPQKTSELPTQSLSFQPLQNSLLQSPQILSTQPSYNQSTQPPQNSSVYLAQNSSMQPSQNSSVQEFKNSTIQSTQNLYIQPQNVSIQPCQNSSIQLPHDSSLRSPRLSSIQRYWNLSIQPLEDSWSIQPGQNSPPQPPQNSPPQPPQSSTLQGPQNSSLQLPQNSSTLPTQKSSTQPPQKSSMKSAQKLFTQPFFQNPSIRLPHNSLSNPPPWNVGTNKPAQNFSIQPSQNSSIQPPQTSSNLPLQHPLILVQHNPLVQPTQITSNLPNQNTFVQPPQDSSIHLSQNITNVTLQNPLIMMPQNPMILSALNSLIQPPQDGLPPQNASIQSLQNSSTQLHQIASSQNFQLILTNNTYNATYPNHNPLSQNSTQSNPQLSGSTISFDVSSNQKTFRQLKRE